MWHLLLVVSILSMGTMSFGKMQLDYQWKYLDFLWDSPRQKQNAIDSGAYNASLAYIYDVDIAPDGRVFITAPVGDGIPVSVMTVTEKQGEGGPLLRPYPNWSWYNNTSDCNGIQAGVYQSDIKCNHLFIVDGGRSEFSQLCLPQLLIFDLSTDKLVKRVRIPIKIALDKTEFSLLASIFVHAPDCTNVKDNAIVFMGDIEGSGLVVYNARTSNLCRVESDFMKANDVHFVVDNLSYPMNDTIFGLSIIGENLYYASLVGSKIYKVEYSKLIQCSQKDINEANQQTQVAGALQGVTAIITADRCAMFFSDIAKTSIMCADATKPFDSTNTELIAHDPVQLQFVSGMKVRKDNLLVVSSRYHIHVARIFNLNSPYEQIFNTKEINFRVFSMPIKEIQKTTNCFSSCK